MGRTQNLRDFTVRIYPMDGDPILNCAGTGFAVKKNDSILVVTAAHVVQQATGCTQDELKIIQVGVHFPSAREDKKKTRVANVAAIFDDAQDDVVLLEIGDDPGPLDPEQLAIIGRAINSEDNPFKTYGYAPVDEKTACRAQGTIMGSVEVDLPANENLHAEPIELRSTDIRPGLSGSAVLDRELNLVVGLVTERGMPNTEYSSVAYAIDMAVLELEPFGLNLNEQTVFTRSVSAPRIRAVPAPALVPKLMGAPEELVEWVGREDLLQSLNSDWENPRLRLTCLAGLVGEGKSMLARHWLETLLGSETPPDGVFWWGFAERPDVPMFMQEALTYMTNGYLDPRLQGSVSAQTRALGAMMECGRFLFILDGLEALQQPEGDGYGLIRSDDLLMLLRFFARPGHASHCLLTSRLPVLDLLDESSYIEREVGPLDIEEGITLLKSKGVWGPWEELKSTVLSRGGHALALNVLAEDLVRCHDGNIERLNQFPALAEGEDSQQLQRLILSYDGCLSKNQRWLLKVLIILKSPVDNKELGEIVEHLGGFPYQEKDNIETALAHFVQLHLVYKDPFYNQYMAKALVKENYTKVLDQTELKEIHQTLIFHYLEMANLSRTVQQYFLEESVTQPPPMSWIKTPDRVYPVDSRLPLMDAVYHACHAHNYDQAYGIYRNGIQGDDWSLAHQLGHYETDLGLLRCFFPDSDLKRLPLVSQLSDRTQLINQVGYCEMQLGRPMQALPFFRRSSKLDEESGDMSKASSSLINAVEALIHLGELDQAQDTLDVSASLVKVAGDPQDRFQPCVLEGWLAFNKGELDRSGKAFENALVLQREFNPGVNSLYFTPGFAQALYFYRNDNPLAARSITETNLVYCQEYGWIPLLSRCCRLLGQLHADQGDQSLAKEEHDKALNIALLTSDRPVLIEALWARGLWEARYGNNSKTAFVDLEEALELAQKGCYRLYEVDIHIALGWAYLSLRKTSNALAQAQRASGMSADMDYYWGKVDSQGLLANL